MERNFMQMLQARWGEGKFVCVGLDSKPDKLPRAVSSRHLDAGWNVFNFNRHIIEATKDIVCAYKPNVAFYEARGAEGIKALVDTCIYMQEKAPQAVLILDAKRADIGNTNEGYAEFAFDICGADAITVHPYLGMEAMKPFLDRADKGVIVLCRTSNPGASEFQDLTVKFQGDPDRLYDYDDHEVSLYQWVARRVSKTWDYNGNCAVVVGATYPGELVQVRKIVGEMPILIPGEGAQGGEVEAAVHNGKDSAGQGFLISSSRDIIFASDGPDFAEAARRETLKLHQGIQQALRAA